LYWVATVRAWREVAGRVIGFINLDLANEYDRLTSVLTALVHARVNAAIVHLGTMGG
jgi:hypothetical protein